MTMASRLLTAAGGGIDKLYVDDVFSAYTYTGNGSTQTINNGIDLAGKGGMVWIKKRNGTNYHHLYDTARGAGKELYSNTTSAATNWGYLSAFNSSGFSLTGDANVNGLTSPYASWTFKKAPKFFDVVTYTGNGVNRTISHALNVVPGMMIIKRTDAVANWQVYHRSNANTEYMILDGNVAKATSTTRWNSTTPTTSVFSVGTDVTVNASGGTYVAYLFAHDTSADGIVQCGVVNDGEVVTLGWEPQYVLMKYAPADWYCMDANRGMSLTSTNTIYPNKSDAEMSVGAGYILPSATGFKLSGGWGASNIYLAIRRPNKPPTVGTQVYNAIARTGTGAAATVTGVGFAPDMLWSADRTGTNSGGDCRTFVFDRLRGASQQLMASTTTAEASNTAGYDLKSFDMSGISLGAPSNSYINVSDPISNHFFKRAPGVFDVVCWTTTGNTNARISHSLGVAPELIIVKSRTNGAAGWATFCNGATSLNQYFQINNTSAIATIAGIWGAAAPNFTDFGVSETSVVGASGNTAVSYLFATKNGISKVGVYIGNGSTQTIDCGFTTGSRFVMIRRVSSDGDTYVWDTARGLVAGNDPHLSLNSTTAAEVTTNDSLDPASVGFVVNQLAATNINVTSATYIYLSFA